MTVTLAIKWRSNLRSVKEWDRRRCALTDGRINDPNRKTNVPPFQGGT
jgi:hypothetical protein